MRRPLASDAPHCAHGCTTACWQLVNRDTDRGGPPGLVGSDDSESSDSESGSESPIYRYGIDTPASPDSSSDRLPGNKLLYFLCSSQYLPLFLLASSLMVIFGFF